MTMTGVTATVHPESFHLISFSRMGSAGRKPHEKTSFFSRGLGGARGLGGDDAPAFATPRSSLGVRRRWWSKSSASRSVSPWSTSSSKLRRSCSAKAPKSVVASAFSNLSRT